MPAPGAFAGDTSPRVTDEERAIRERVKELTSQMLQHGRVDTDAVRRLVDAMMGQSAGKAAGAAAERREFFAETLRELDERLFKSAGATHEALQQLASRGKDFTDNDLKLALESLRGLEEAYLAAANRVTEAMSGNLRREMTELAGRARDLGTEATARVATMITEFSGRMSEGASSGLETMRGTSVRMALLASGVLAGIADALRDRTEADKSE